MKLLPVRINGRTDYMVDFDVNSEYEHTFVVASDEGGELLRLNPYLPSKYENAQNVNDLANQSTAEGFEYQIDTGHKQVFLTGIEFGDEEGVKYLKLLLSYTRCHENIGIPTNANPGLSYGNGVIRYASQDDLKKLRVIVNLSSENNGEEASSSFVVYLTPSGQIYNAVVDCGSEASQIAAFKGIGGEDFGPNKRLCISSNILYHFGFDDREHNEFIQYEDSDECLFKTIFYAKKSFNETDIAPEKICPLEDERENPDSILRMCVKKEELERIKDTHLQLYNMKIAGYGGIIVPNIRYQKQRKSIKEYEVFFQRKYISQFIFQCLCDFCNTSPYVQQPKVMNLNMLVPNIYSYKKTHDFISMVYKDTLEMIEKNESFKKKVQGVCINPVSESDASLIGAVSLRRNRYTAGTYLVLDAGKGTLDFSLTKYERGKFINIMKSGFVGASAAISYGFMLDLLREFLETESIVEKVDDDILRKFIYENILGGNTGGGGDMYGLNRLMNVVDGYKIKFTRLNGRRPERKTVPNPEPLNSITIEAFAQWVERCSYKVSTDNVDAILSVIINSVSRKLLLYTETTVQFVVFAGRGFLYEPFKQKMLDMLKRDWPDLKEISFIEANDAADNKNICLFITDAINEGRYESNELPDPLDIHRDISEQINHSENMSGSAENVGDSLSKIFSAIKLNVKSKAENKKDSGDVSNYRENSFVFGHKTTIGGDIDIIIGGTTYTMDNQVKRDEGYLFYSNGRIYVRINGAGVHLLNESVDLTTGLAYPSLFPYCAVLNEDGIYIPEYLRKEVSECVENAEENNQPNKNVTVLDSAEENNCKEADKEKVKVTERDKEKDLEEKIVGKGCPFAFEENEHDNPLDRINKHKGNNYGGKY